MFSNLIKYLIVISVFGVMSVIAVLIFIFPIQNWDLTAWIFLIVGYIALLQTSKFLFDEKETEFIA